MRSYMDVTRMTVMGDAFVSVGTINCLLIKVEEIEQGVMRVTIVDHESDPDLIFEYLVDDNKV